MKKLLIRIWPRGDGTFWIWSEWGYGWWSHKTTGLSEEELITEVTKEIKGSIAEWSKK